MKLILIYHFQWDWFWIITFLTLCNLWFESKKRTKDLWLNSFPNDLCPVVLDTSYNQRWIFQGSNYAKHQIWCRNSIDGGAHNVFSKLWLMLILQTFIVHRYTMFFCFVLPSLYYAWLMKFVIMSQLDLRFCSRYSVVQDEVARPMDNKARRQINEKDDPTKRWFWFEYQTSEDCIRKNIMK